MVFNLLDYFINYNFIRIVYWKLILAAKPGYLCKFRSGTYEDYHNCASVFNTEDRTTYLLNKIEGDWRKYYRD